MILISLTMKTYVVTFQHDGSYEGPQYVLWSNRDNYLQVIHVARCYLIQMHQHIEIL